MTNSVDPGQTVPIGAVCTGSMQFASVPNLSVMLGKYLQQTTSADDIKNDPPPLPPPPPTKLSRSVHGSHLGYQNVIILAIPNLHVALKTDPL